MGVGSYILINLISAIFVATIRIISYAKFFDGVFFVDANITAFVSVIFVIIPLIFSLVYYFKNNKLGFSLIKVNNTVLGITALLCSVFSFISVYLMYDELVYNATNNLSNSTIIGFSFDVPLFVLTIILLLYLVFISFVFLLKKRYIMKKYKIFASIAPIWSFFFVLYSYIHNNSSLLISENLFNMLIPCALALCLIDVSKILSDLDYSSSAFKRLIVSFSVSSVLSVGYFVGNIVLNSFDVVYKSDLPFSIQIMTVVINFFIAIFIVQTKYNKFEFKEEENNNINLVKAN